MQNFRALGAPPSDPRASGGWRLCPQTPSLRRLGASPPDPHWPPAAEGSAPRPPKQTPIANFWLRAWTCPCAIRSHQSSQSLRQAHICLPEVEGSIAGRIQMEVLFGIFFSVCSFLSFYPCDQ